MTAILNSVILNFGQSGFSHLNFLFQTHSHLPDGSHYFHKNTSLIHYDSTWWLAAILNSTLLNLAMVDSTILHKTLTQTNLIWLKLYSFSLKIDDGSHLEICHVGLRHCPIGFRHLAIFFSDSLRNTLTPLWLWLKLIQSDSNSFILT